MLSIMPSTKLTTCHTIITSKQHLLHSNRWKPSVQTTSIRLTFQPNKNMFSTPTLFNLFITTLYRKAALYAAPAAFLGIALLDATKGDVASAQRQPDGPWFWWRYVDLAQYLLWSGIPKCKWSVHVQSGSLVGNSLQYKCRFGLSVLWEGDLLGTRYCNTHRHYISTKTPQDYILSKLLEIHTDPNILILKHHPTLPKSQILHGT